ncbi:MAG TPA: CotH kinase family protein [Ignavibacteriaceae bacterium]|nr:CotH kinase family protein [Ignavibacteriaceae bacterium]
MKTIKTLFLIFAISFAGCDVTDNNPANDITSIYLFDSYIRQENLSVLLSNKLISYSVPIQIYTKDDEYKGEIEAQGSASRYLPKWSFEIELDDKRILNLDEFNLSAQVSDPSMIKTKLASYVYKEMGFEVFDSDFAFLKINGKNKGLYYIIERVEEDFFRRRNISVHEMIKTLFGAMFTFNNGNDIYNFFEKEINDDENLFNFENFIYALDTIKQENIFDLENIFDIESYLKYHAASTIIAARDGFRNNIIFYKETADSPYKTLPWDFDGSFNPDFHEILYGDNEIINKLLLNDSCLSLYKNFYTNCLENIFTEANLFPIIDGTKERIEMGYALDPYLGEAGYNLENEVDKLKNFISDRRTILLDNLTALRKL